MVAMQVFVRGAQTAVYEISSLDDVSALKTRIESKTGIRTAHQILSIGGKVLQDETHLPREATLRLSMRLRGGRDGDEQPWGYLQDDWFGVEDLPASMETSLSQAPMTFSNDREFSNGSNGSFSNNAFGAWVGDFAIAAQSAIAASAQIQQSAPPAPPSLPLHQAFIAPAFNAHGTFNAFNADGTFNAASAQLAASSPQSPAACSPSSMDDFEEQHAAAQPSVASLPVPEDLVRLHFPTVHAPSPAAPHSAGMMPKVTIGRGQKGLAYDLDSVDEKVKRRLIKNRLSAERSRQRKNARMESMQGELGTLDSQLENFRTENAMLKTRLAAFENMARKHGLAMP
ncbi:hypothetical protein T484DRAFT_1929751 [Baffinella frigidus]|nr:hypothetical protein T484DRAFT_1929751 [Cryptophyta sp. CCMP2293]|mmetsp:Transcript_13733/g.33301  ORF Transcript_13733/g.33301 Transcript_13733/m.33301 type:complete len:342 (+) Transcript_13733:55-1080(+)